MKIQIDISSVAFGTGVSRYTSNVVYALARMLEDSPHQLQLFGSSLRQLAALKHFTQLVQPRVSNRIIPLPPTLMTKLLHDWNVAIEYLAGPSDVFHTWDWYLPRSKRSKVIYTLYDVAMFKYPEVAHPEILAHHKHILPLLVERDVPIVTISESTRRDAIELFSIKPENIQVIYPALPQEHAVFVSEKSIEQTLRAQQIKKPYMLLVGTQEPRKNIPRMVAAWKEHFSKDYALVLVGKSAWEDIPSHPNMIRTGYVSSGELACLYAGASCFLYCSLYEGFGFPILEAWFHAVPVVTANTSSLPEIAGKAAVLVDPLDVDAIAAGITKSLDTADSLREKGKVRLQKFSWEDTARSLLSVYGVSLHE